MHEHNHSMMSHDEMDHMSHESMPGMGHMAHMGNLKVKFFWSLVLAIPIIILSPMMGMELPFQFTFPGSDWLVLILATILFIYGGKPFLSGAKMELKDRSPAMMTLISLGISVAYFYSLYAFIMNHFINSNAHIMDFFWELATLIVIMLLGHWIEMRAVSNAGDALKKMAELLPTQANRLEKDGSSKKILLKEVQVGDLLLIKAGEKIPADGKIVEGQSSINESMVTGEAKEVKKNRGDKVIGGAVNGSGTLTIEVSGTGDTGYLAQVMNLVGDAQKEKSKVESLSDKVAKWLFYVALFVGIFTFIIWFFLTKELTTPLERMVTVLVIACPHALGLAIPLVTARSTSLGAKNGLLIRNRNALEAAKKIDSILMDKTGTLTEGAFKVHTVESLTKEYSEEQILAYFAALERTSTHPLAVGILTKAEAEKVTIPVATETKNMPGIGLSGKINQEEISIVTAAYLEKMGIVYDKKHFEELASLGNSISYLVRKGEAVGLIAQGDKIKSGAKAMIAALIAEGIEPVMVTGDNATSAEMVANQLGINQVYAGLMPEDKEKIVKDYQKNKKVVMMVGDGVNDAPSLARADVGVAIGAGTDIAIDSADVILVKSDPNDILHFLSLAKNTTRKMIQNLWWGAGYNIIAIPLAAGILAPIGFILSPAVGAILMSLSTVIVALNALTLRIK
ncbi:heavy metal translocating P-type ATPase [Carnobacterium maltaromaticum]|uniref:heavy metal translocating P-type ATPase n=1 Tax=Carnobacterium maltaromaticum TaxID=2751 RepID=UPI000704FBE4|nr:heavy metal translocating P-type ATPase [Carnobacterium maltaromaticum]MBC9808615.1 cadmium-translocating P-type ATPase [Carnobacterium maltaromaticum]MDW5522457.1 heavy metal translocating P-type ATPase [Carnobacterium maltaromaticum]CRH20094.1 Copper-exporting P-type ATPase B [Carnobacterium maltaromaticum]CRH21873.1 Copper-exporting P-type ATPase B [Carnobacterium maltaromaticum]